MFWFPSTADFNNLSKTSGVALVTKASIGIKFPPLIKMGYLPSKMKNGY